MYAIIEEQGGSSHPRGEPRMKVLLSGELRSRRGIIACRIHDLSRGGARVEADMALPSGESVTFVRGGLEVKGVVAWSEGRRFGVTFDERIRATDLLVQMSHSRQTAAPCPAPVSAAATPLFPSR